MNNKTHLKLIASSIALSYMASAPSTQASQLEEVIVTAQKRAESLQEVPIAVSAFTGETLSKLGLDDVRSLSNVTPGLNFGFNAGRANAFIRGVGANIGAGGNEMPIAVYYDGQYSAENVSAAYFEFFGIERVEVLKGPQGTLFGRNATGGAINVITSEPTPEFSAKLEATYGNYGSWETKAYVSGPLSSNAELLGSLDVITKESDGYLKNRNPLNGLSDEDVGGSELDAVRGKLLWHANDKLSVTLIADWLDSEDRAAGAWQPMNEFPTVGEGLVNLGLLPPELGTASRKPYDFWGGTAGVMASETSGFSFTVDWTTGFADIKYIGAYRDVDIRQAVDADAVEADIFSYDAYQFNETLQHEVQLISNGEGPLSWTAGVFYLEDEARYDGLGLFVGVPWNATPQQVADAMLLDPTAAFLVRENGRTSESWAVYGEAYYELNERTKLTLGLRYTWEDLSLHQSVDTVMLPDDPNMATSFNPLVVTQMPEEEENFADPSWSLVIDHNFTDDIMGYLSYKRGFKSGVYSIADPNAREATEPEEIDAYEIGLKSTLLDGTLRLNAAAFFYDYANLQVQRVDPQTGGAVADNAAEAEIKGAEFDVQWLPLDNLSITMGLSLLDAEYTDYAEGVVLLPHPAGLGFVESTADLSNTPLPQTADYQFNIGANYYLPLGDSGSLNFYANWYHTDDITRVEITEWSYGSYDRLNASITWSSPEEKFYVKLWGNNLTDEEVANGVSPLALGYMLNYSPDMTFGITAGLQFGD